SAWSCFTIATMLATTPASLRNCSSCLSPRPVGLFAAAAGDLVTECANACPQPINKFASLAAKRSVIHPALLLDGVARSLRVGLQEGQHGIRRLLILQLCHGARSAKRSFTNTAI